MWKDDQYSVTDRGVGVAGGINGGQGTLSKSCEGRAGFGKEQSCLWPEKEGMLAGTVSKR